MSKYLKKVHCDGLEIQYIEISRQNRPKNLPKPYEYVLSIAKTNALVEKLKKFLDPKEVPNDFAKNPKPKPNGIYQFAGVRKKNISKGIKINVFVLGNSDEATKEQWDETCKFVQDQFYKYLGKDAEIYAEKFSETRKFQARFETYIMYKENQ